MVRRILAVATVTFSTALLVLACKAESSGPAAGGGAAEGGASAKPKKLTCRMEGQCWVCPDEAAIKKCIINPVTSGCTKGTDSDCR
jgi:hypothetical protein